MNNSKLNDMNYSRMENLQMDNIGEYSITLPREADQISHIIKNIKPLKDKKITITDATAGIGGNTLSFSIFFNKVNAIEIDRVRYNYLINNLSTFNATNVNVFNDDMLNIINKSPQDVIFIDPPWGGKNYKRKRKIRLKISDSSLEEVCNYIFNKNISDVIALKLPFNYDFEYLYSNINRQFIDILKYEISSRIVLVILYNSINETIPITYNID
jgi:predicted RNA methylase